MITAEQIRAARALLRFSLKDLAEKSGVSLPTIQRMEAGTGVPNGRIENLEKIEKSLINCGVIFIDANGGGPGVRLKSQPQD